MDTASLTAPPAGHPAPDRETLVRAPRWLLVLCLAGTADWLFPSPLDRHIGISIAIFAALVSLASAIANSGKVRLSQVARGSAVVALGVLPYAMQPSILAGLFAIFTIAIVAVSTRLQLCEPLLHRATKAVRLVLDCGWRFVPDIVKFVTKLKSGKNIMQDLLAWVVPVVLGLVFLALFASANPVIGSWMPRVNFHDLGSQVGQLRIPFWLIVISLVWPFVFVQPKNFRSAKLSNLPSRVAQPKQLLQKTTLWSEVLLGPSSILRGLIVFNVLLGIQNSLDVAFLWGNAQLPPGVKYSEYAYGGIYPLMTTILLAAAFILVAFRPDSEIERSSLIAALLFIWISQNICLVISSCIRLNLYVSAYTLTTMRFAGFVWMGLVAAGLVLIAIRIWLRKSNRWLVGANLAATFLVFYVCACTNVPGYIARYNVQHSYELTGHGIRLDLNYLMTLGPQTIPALDQWIVQVKTNRENLANTRREYIDNPFSHALQEERRLNGTIKRYEIRRAHMVTMHRRVTEDWRGWSFWGWRLTKYFEKFENEKQKIN